MKEFHLFKESYRNQGIEGKEILVKWNCTNEIWRNVWMPGICLKEYDEWILVEILPHKNKMGWTKSKPYRMGISKINILFGDYSIKLNEKKGDD